MSTWKTKTFGDTRFNFYGWIIVGLLVIAASVWQLKMAFQTPLNRGEGDHLLVAIYFLLLGQFALSMQNYCARVAKSIEEEDAKKSRPSVTS